MIRSTLENMHPHNALFIKEIFQDPIHCCVTWLHNNISIGYIAGVQVTKVGKKASSISIESINEEHAGTYTCLADNKAGKAEFSVILRVNGI